MEETVNTGWCHMCDPPKLVAAEDLFGHLLGAHDMDIELETWPDGAFVIEDRTLTPSDFLAGQEGS